VFNSCTDTTLLGTGAEAKVYLNQIIIGGTVHQIASKIYFRKDRARSELMFYEGLPLNRNILRIFGPYVDRKTKRSCLAMELCRHGSMR
jgi:hypothetical protein